MDLNGRILYLPTRLSSFDTVPSVVGDTPSEETNIEPEKNVVQIGISFSKGSIAGDFNPFEKYSSWSFQPIPKILVKMGIFPR